LAYARSTGVILHPPPPPPPPPGSEAFGPDLGGSFLEKDDFVPSAEGEIGIEWSRDVGRLRPFIQAGVVGQGWFNALTNNNGNSGIPPTYVNGNGLLGLLGISITGGLSF